MGYAATTMVKQEMTLPRKAVTSLSHHQTSETAGKWLKSLAVKEVVKELVQDVTLMRKFFMKNKTFVVKSQILKGRSVIATPKSTQLVILKTAFLMCACTRGEEMCSVNLLHRTLRPAKALEQRCTAGETKSFVVRTYFLLSFALFQFFSLS